MADDQEFNRDLLNGLGCTVRTVSDGAAALDLLAREVVDPVLTDVRMPALDAPGGR